MIIRYGSRNPSTPKTEVSLAKVNCFQLLPVATKNSLKVVGGILDTTLIKKIQKSWDAQKLSATLSPKGAYVLSVLFQ